MQNFSQKPQREETFEHVGKDRSRIWNWILQN